MGMISALKTYLSSYTGLEAEAPMWVNHWDALGIQYSIVPLPGSGIVDWYLNGKSEREFIFAFQSVESTVAELSRIESVDFFEELSDWVEDQSNLGILPVLSPGKTALSLEAISQAYLFETGASDTGIYQIQMKLVYEQL